MNNKSARKFLQKVLFFSLIVLVLNFLVGFVLEIPTKLAIKTGNFYPSIRWKDFYALEKNSLDIVFLGSSHCYRSFDPALIDAELGTESFNMGSSSQSAITSYYVFQEILRFQRPKVVVLELYWKTLHDDNQFTNASYNYEYMQNGTPKRDLFINAFFPYDWLNYLFPSFRYRRNIGNLVKLLVGEDADKLFGRDDEWYEYRGFVKSVGEFDQSEKNEFENYMFSTTSSIGWRNVFFLSKLVTSAKNNGIQVVGVVAPLPSLSLSHIANYEEIHSFYEYLSNDLGIIVVDYNLINHSERIFKDSDFKDDDHLNYEGVQKLCNDIVERVLKSALSD
mgnify:CR=1 FL=1